MASAIAFAAINPTSWFEVAARDLADIGNQQLKMARPRSDCRRASRSTAETLRFCGGMSGLGPQPTVATVSFRGTTFATHWLGMSCRMRAIPRLLVLVKQLAR